MCRTRGSWVCSSFSIARQGIAVTWDWTSAKERRQQCKVWKPTVDNAARCSVKPRENIELLGDALCNDPQDCHHAGGPDINSCYQTRTVLKTSGRRAQEPVPHQASMHDIFVCWSLYRLFRFQALLSRTDTILVSSESSRIPPGTACSLYHSIWTMRKKETYPFVLPQFAISVVCRGQVRSRRAYCQGSFGVEVLQHRRQSPHISLPSSVTHLDAPG